jgi:hypothetical protein
VETDTTGGSTLGYSLTPRKVYPMIPKRIMTIEMTLARTGRLMLTEEIFMAGEVKNQRDS